MEKLLFDGKLIELKPGMVLRYDRLINSNGYLLYLGNARDFSSFYGYDMKLVDHKVRLCSPAVVVPRDVNARYKTDRPGGLFYDSELAALMALATSDEEEGQIQAQYLAWERSEPVREMTVNEISAALGYKVKVVGEK